MAEEVAEFQYVLSQTCFACPEQYDLFDKHANKLGILRLRYGRFTARNVLGEVVYEANPKGDGAFESDEREAFLQKGIECLITKK